MPDTKKPLPLTELSKKAIVELGRSMGRGGGRRKITAATTSVIQHFHHVDSSLSCSGTLQSFAEYNYGRSSTTATR